MSILVDVVADKSEWGVVLAQLGGHDFVHTFDFHRASQENGEGLPLMFVARDATGIPVASWQILQRDIPGTAFFDFTSVYGYAGPILSKDVDGKLVLNAIWEEMRHYGAVSLFSRMHPLFIEQISDESLRGQRLSDVVVIDVKKVANVLAAYRGSHRREIVNSKKIGMSIDIDYKCQYLDDFIDIYRRSMSDLGTSEYYYFSDAYFDAMKNASNFRSIIFFAELDGKKIATSMFIVTGDIMQYYLSGTVSEYRRLAPSKLIIAGAHELAMGLDIKSLVLGGGVGSAQDALFKFKSGFSKITKPFYIQKKILNEAVYSRLCSDRSIDCNQISFFPAYRA